MTLLIAWVACDDKPNGKEISALYIGSDSRYSWNKGIYCDSSQKVFGSTKKPHIFGFCGDVTFVASRINALVDAIDHGIMLNSANSAAQIVEKVTSFLDQQVNSYPKEILLSDSVIYHGFRLSPSEFHLAEYKINHRILSGNLLPLPARSECVAFNGSGIQDWRNVSSQYGDYHNDYKTSRLAYHMLDLSIRSSINSSVGGVPQFIGLYRSRNAIYYGIIKEGKRYFNGIEIKKEDGLEGLEWRNENFERIDPRTLKLLDNAQHQPIVAPKNIK